MRIGGVREMGVQSGFGGHAFKKHGFRGFHGGGADSGNDDDRIVISNC
jgi:hypothetical protein